MTKSVLLCDDEMHILRAAEFKLKRSGFDVTCTGDGEEAWESIREKKPHILVADYQMPRLDGMGLVARIREHDEFADIPVIMLTAKGFELAQREDADRYNVLAILAKPFSPRELLHCVQQVIETGSLDRPPALL